MLLGARQQGGIGAVDEKLRTALFQQEMIGADMIEVAVRIDHHLEMQAESPNMRKDAFTLLPWIDDQSLFARLTTDNKAIDLQRPDHQCL